MLASSSWIGACAGKDCSVLTKVWSNELIKRLLITRRDFSSSSKLFAPLMRYVHYRPTEPCLHFAARVVIQGAMRGVVH